MILLTHAHFDHMLGAREFSEKFRTPVAVGEKDEYAMYDPALNGALLFGVSDFHQLDSCMTLREGDQVQVGDAVKIHSENTSNYGGGCE